jgi:hypothetical protein
MAFSVGGALAGESAVARAFTGASKGINAD